MFNEERFRQDLSNAIRCEYGIAKVDFTKRLSEQIKSFDAIDRIHLSLLVEQVSGRELNIAEFIKVANINNKVDDIVAIIKELSERKPAVDTTNVEINVKTEEEVMVEGSTISVDGSTDIAVDPSQTVANDVTADNTEYQINENENSISVDVNNDVAAQEEVTDGSVSND